MADLTVVQAIDDFMAAATQAAMRTALGLGTIATQAASAVSISGGTLAGLTGLAIRDTSAAFDVTIAATSSVTLNAGRTLTFDVVNASKTVKLGGNLTTADAFVTAGAFSLTLTTTGVTTVTLPTAGTLAILGANTFTGAQVIAPSSAATCLTLTGGTVTTSLPVIDAAQTWNAAASFTFIKGNVTATSFTAGSKLLDLQVGGNSAFTAAYTGGGNPYMTFGVGNGSGFYGTVLQSGGTTVGYFGATSSAGYTFSLGGNYYLGFYSVNSPIPGDVPDLRLVRKTAATLQMGVDAAGVTNQMFTAASRVTSDGVGANLTLSAGNGRGGAGGSLIFSTYDTQATGVIGVLQTRLTLDTTGLLTFADAVNMAFNATTGTKFGTATSQKLSFWNKAPIAQPTTGISAASFTANTSLIANDSATFGGYTLGQIAAALVNIGILT